MPRRLAIAILATVFVATGAAGASGSPKFDQAATVRLPASKAAKRTPVYFDLGISDPGAPQDKPKTAKRITVRLPSGLTYNPSVVPVCSIAEAVQTGCPDETLVGGGVLMYNFSPYLDPSDPFVHAQFRIHRWKGDATARGNLVFFPSWDPGVILSGVPLYDHGQVQWLGTLSRRGLLTMKLPEVSPVSHPLLLMNLALGRLPKGKPSPLRTPRRCNPEKGWRSRVTVAYEDQSTEKDTTKHRCRR